MEIVICKTKEEASRKAADLVAALMAKKPKAVLGLATGSTPVQLYKYMAQDCAAGKISFKQAKSWNLDEYLGLAPTHDQSYRYFMDKNLFEHIDIPRKNTHVLNGLAKDWKKEVSAYEAAIKKAGGIDLQVLGIGSDGHIAFNEPGSSLASRTRLVSLTPQTVKDNARFFKKAADVPKQALSMGVGTIMEARRIILLAFGANKAEAVKGAVEGGVSQFCTASALQMHPDSWFFCDEAAAAKLKLRKYYAWRAEEALKAELDA
ncbi:MAG: glucosamine-6-phosphate deaminase [Kiritimatiellae bacterium]|nr:glucosamine-6-phosphate deaminase [Kiritimatiellia bacterium]